GEDGIVGHVPPQTVGDRASQRVPGLDGETLAYLERLRPRHPKLTVVRPQLELLQIPATDMQGGCDLLARGIDSAGAERNPVVTSIRRIGGIPARCRRRWIYFEVGGC